MTPRIHSAQIKAWADGAQIQYYAPRLGGTWWDVPGNRPEWNPDTVYRVKPAPGPDIVLRRYVRANGLDMVAMWRPGGNPANVEFVFDGDTFELKSVKQI